MVSKKNFLILSTADWSSKYWTNKQNVAKEIAKKGHNVLYVESVGIRKPNISSKKDFLRASRKIFHSFKKNKKKGNIQIISPPIIPFKTKFKFFFAIYNDLLENKIIEVLKKDSIEEINIITYHPFFELKKLKSYTNKIIYHCVDDLSSVEGIPKNHFKVYDKKLIKQADCIFTCCDDLYNKFKKMRKKVYFLKNAVSEDFIKKSTKKYKIPSELKKIKKPIFGFHGVISDFKLNLKIYLKIIVENKDCNFLFIGDEYEFNKEQYFKKIIKKKNVFFINYKKYLELPKYLKHIDFGLLIYKNNQYTNNMFPLKINELLLCDTPVMMSNINAAKYFSKGIINLNSGAKNFKNYKKYTKKNKILGYSERNQMTYSNLVNSILKESNI